MSTKEYRKILIATDGSEGSRKAAMSGVKIASLSGAQVIALYVAEMECVGITPEAVHRDFLASMEMSMSDHMSADQCRAFARIADEKWSFQRHKHLYDKGHEVTEYVNSLGKSMGVEVRSIIKEGHPASVIIDVARNENVDLVVIGTLGIGSDGTFQLGRVADRVIRNSFVEVLAVR